MRGDAPKSTSNIHLLFISSKIISLTTLLHLSVSQNSVEKLGLDDDTSMLEYLTSSIISNLSASIDNMVSLNLNMKETRNLFNSSKSCIHVIKSTAMWIGLIFHRATFIIRNVDTSSNKMSVLYAAIKKMVESRCSLAIKVLTKALSILFDTASTNKLGKSLNVDLALDKAFHCCLGVIRKVIGFFHACEGCSEGNSSADTRIMSSVFSDYQNFMVSHFCLVILTCIVGLTNALLLGILDTGAESDSNHNRNQKVGCPRPLLPTICWITLCFGFPMLVMPCSTHSIQGHLLPEKTRR